MNTKYVYKIAVLISLSVIIVIFTNCGQPSTLVFENGNISNNIGSSDPASASVLAFEETVYPITRMNCIGCHNVDSSSPTSPFHASDHVSEAHDSLVKQGKINFGTPGSSRIVQKLLQAGGHNCWGVCADNAAEMTAAVTRWGVLANIARDPAGGTGTIPGITTVKTDTISLELAKAANATVTVNTGGVTLTGKTLTWRINELLGNPAIVGDILFRVDIFNYDIYSYQIRNPRIVVPATAGVARIRVFVRNSKIVINDILKPEHPTYTVIERTSALNQLNANGTINTAATTVTTILSTSAMLALKDKGPAEDRIAFNFQELKVDTGNNAQLSVVAFERSLYVVTRANCAGCHNANQRPFHASATVQIAHDASLGIVNFTDAAQSPIVLKIKNGHQNVDPVGVPAAMEAAIREWAASR